MADANRTMSIRLALEDNDFKTKIKTLSNEMNVFKSELAKVESEYIGQQNTLSALTAKYGVYEKMLANLNDKIKTYSDKNDQLRKSLADLQATREKQTQSLEEYRRELEKVQVSLNMYKEQHTRVNASYNEAKAAYDKAKTALKEFEEQYTGTTRNFPWYKQKHEELNKAVQEAKVKHDQWKNALKTASYNVKEATERSEAYGTEIKALEADLVSLDNQERDVNKAINDNTAASNRAQKQANETATTMAIYEDAMEDAGKSTDGTTDKIDAFTGKAKEASDATEALAQALAVELVKKGFDVVKDAITSSMNSFKEFESALAGVSKTTGMAWGGEEIKALGDDFKALSQQIPVSASELLNVAQIAGQLGISGSENIQKFTTVMAQMSVSTNLSAEEAATALAQMAAVTGMAAEDYDKLGSAIVSLGNKYPVAEDTIVRIAQRFSGAAVNANLAEGSIVALAAAAGSVGLQAESAGTSLTKLVTKMSDAVQSGDNLEEWAKVANMSAEDFARLWGKDAPQAIAKFLGGFGKLGNEASNTLNKLGIGEARLQDLVRRMANAEASSEMLSRALRDANEAFSEGVALGDEASVVYETLASRTKILQNSTEVLGTEVGSVLAPQLSALIQMGTDVVQFVTNLVQECPEVVYGLEAITIALGVMTVKALPEAVPLIGKTIEGFKGLATILTGTNWTGAFSVINEGLAFLATASASTVLAIGGVITALALLAIGIAKYSEDGDVASKKTQYASEAYESQKEIVEALTRAKKELAATKGQYAKEEELCGQASQDTTDKLDEQQARVNELQALYDEFAKNVNEATDAEETFTDATDEAISKVEELTASFKENIKNVKDYSTNYKATAKDYIKEIQQQIEWNNKYSSNRDKLLSRNIQGLREWVATWDDGTAEAAQKMNAFANASDSDIEAIISALGTLTAAEQNNAASFETAMAQSEQSAKTHIDGIKRAIDSVQGKTVYINVVETGAQTSVVKYDRTGRVNQVYTMAAQGLNYVPYDGFAAMLHEGERVLNRAEASAYRQLELSGNNTTNNNNNNITLNVYGSAGQSVNELSDAVMRRIQKATNQRQAVWA